MKGRSLASGYRSLVILGFIALAPLALWGCWGDSDDSTPELGLKASCGSGDNPETGLQGQTTIAERMGGSAAKGINCNLRLLGGREFTQLLTQRVRRQRTHGPKLMR